MLRTNVPSRSNTWIRSARRVAHVNEAVVGQPQAMRQRWYVALGLGARERPLSEKPSLTVEHRDALIAAGELTIGDVDVAGLGVDVDRRGEKELRAVGVQWLAVPGAVRRVIFARLAYLEQQVAPVARVLLNDAGGGRDDPDVSVPVDVAVVKPTAEPVRIAPGTDNVAAGVELNHRGAPSARRRDLRGLRFDD